MSVHLEAIYHYVHSHWYSHIQLWNPYQITNGVFHWPGTKISQFVWKHKTPPMRKSLLRNNGNGGIWLPDFRLYYKTNHQDYKVLDQRWIYRSMEQNRESRDEATHPWPPCLWQRRHQYATEQRQPLEQAGLGKQVNHIKRMKCFLMAHTQTNAKWIKDLSGRPETIMTFEKNIGRTISDRNHSKIFSSVTRLPE